MISLILLFLNKDNLKIIAAKNGRLKKQNSERKNIIIFSNKI